MNYCVPDFEMNDDDSIPTSSRSARQKKSILPEDELVELLWQNGQVVMQSQNQRSFKKCSQKFPAEDAVLPAEVSTAMEARAFADVNEEAANQLFIQEDEMASWLHYPADDSFERDFCTDLLYPSPPGNYASSCRSSLVQEDRRSEEKSPAISRPPIPPTRRMELDSSMKIHNFKHFSRPKSKTESGPSISDKAVRESTVVDSSETPVFRPGSVGKSPMAVSGGNLRYGSMNGDAGAAGMVREFAASEPAVMSSSGGSGASASFSAEPSLKPPADDKKRKAREADYNDCQSEDVDFESIDAKKQVRGSTSSRRTRAAEVHNLSERKRRDRINEKMKALQELIPRCNKSDKASMLDEAIEYLKSLQLQVQMMSMGCSMVPMMYPGFQPYMSPMGMGMGMSMGMGMDMGLNRPMLPFPSALAGSSMPTPASAAHLGPRVPMPAFHVPPIPATDLSRIQETNQSNPALNAIGRPSPNQPQIPNFADPYQHYHGLHQMEVPPPQNQAMAQPSTSKGVGTLENHQSG